METELKKILIAEDEKPMARALELKLNNSGFKALAVFNGEEALEAIEEEKYDLILLDLVMPKMDGFEFLNEAKKRSLGIPVMILSNLSQEEDLKKTQEFDFVKGFFVKSDTPIADIVKKARATLQ